MSVAADLPSAPAPQATLATQFAGRRGRLFWMALRFSVLNVLTLGLYRFWMKTRLRRYYWSAIRPGNLPLEYTGRPLEKLLGFLIAVTFLAFYIGIVNLVLMFLSLTLFRDDFGAYLLSFIGVIPFLFYAGYRRRRYILARTRWRGLRFGLEPGAWGYAWRAMGHWVLTILTGGLLWPRMTFWLEKYRTDRTHFGSVTLAQGGRWTMLFAPILPLLTGVVACAAVIGATYVLAVPAYLWLQIPALLWVIYGLAHYRAVAFRKLTDAKTAGPLRLRARPRPLRVFRIYLMGSALIVIVLMVFLTALVLLLGALLNGAVSDGFIAGIPDALRNLPRWAQAALAVLLYFNAFVFWDVLAQVFLTLPLVRHFAETLTIEGAEALPDLRQRPRDEFAEAEGFAEALDVGAAI